LNQEHPPLAKILFGLSNLLYEKIAGKEHQWHNHLPTNLLPYRFPVFLLSILLAIGIYIWTKSIAGFLPALISLLLYVFSPQIISNSTIATLDLPFTFFFFLSLYLLRKFGRLKGKIDSIILIFLSLSFVLLLYSVSSPLYHFKYSEKEEKDWYKISFSDNNWVSFNQFLKRLEGSSEIFVRFWVEKDKLKDYDFLIAADDCIKEIYVNEKKIYENVCDKDFHEDGIHFDLEQYLTESKNLVAVRIVNRVGAFSFDVMNEKTINYAQTIIGIFLIFLIFLADFPSAIIGMTIGLSVLTREAGIILIFVSFIWFLYLFFKRKDSIYLRRFLLTILTSFLTLNVGYGFLSSGIYFLGFLPLPIPFLFYNVIINSLIHSKIGHLAYLLGETSQNGWLHYYLIVFLMKTPIPLLILTFLGILNSKIKKDDKVFLILPVFFIFISYSLARADIGIRLILPIYPFLFILASFSFYKTNPKFLLLYWALIIWYVVESLFSFPFYLSYCNLPFRNSCYLYISDSNIDWGQNIYLLGELSKQNKIYCGPLFGGLTPNLQCEFIDCEKKENLKNLDGYLAISQFELFVERKCEWLKYVKPEKTIGYSILLFDLKKLV
jgi:hypothetical protein